MTSSCPHIAIVGSGPAGCYLADALGRQRSDARIDIFERLPTPFGLVRGGVAPDHPGTKAVTRQFERTLARASVRLLGNVEVGRDISIDELRQAYDVVALATGALEDRRLGIHGESLSGVYGSGAFVGWYNGLPDRRDLEPRLGSKVAVIGNGNVALDIARLLAKTPAELAASDLCAHARVAFGNARVKEIWIIGRRGPLDASFTHQELAEFGHLAQAHPVVDDACLPGEIPPDLPESQRTLAEKNLALLREFSRRQPSSAHTVRVHFLFHATPLAIHGSTAVSMLELDSGNGVRSQLPVDTVVTAIGYRSREIPGLAFDSRTGAFANQEGRIASGLYATGWCRRGPQGVVPANRADALAVADSILAELGTPSTSLKPGGELIDSLLQERGIEVVDYAGWQRINAAETAAGANIGSPREKLTKFAELLAVARGESGS